MIYLLLSTGVNLIPSICIAILIYYLFKKLLKRQFIHVKKITTTSINDNEDEDDYLFQLNIDKRSLRPSYSRFTRRKLQQESSNDTYLCVICYNDKKNTVLLPCKHLCVCGKCSKILWNNTQNQICPICRTHIDNMIEIYI